VTQCPIQARENAELLLAYCARKLDPQTAAVLEQHMENCPDCRAFGETQKQVWAALDAWEARPVSPGFDRRLYRTIEAEEHGSWRQRFLQPLMPLRLRPAFPLAAASVLAAAVLLLRAPEAVEFPEPAQAEMVDVERLEKTLEDLEMLRQLNLMARAEPAPSPSM